MHVRSGGRVSLSSEPAPQLRGLEIRCKFPSSNESSLSSDPHAGGREMTERTSVADLQNCEQAVMAAAGKERVAHAALREAITPFTRDGRSATKRHTKPAWRTGGLSSRAAIVARRRWRSRIALKAAVSCALAGHHGWPLGRTASWSVRALPAIKG